MKHLLMLAFFICPFVLCAQDYAAIRQQLADLKKSDQYYRLILDSLFRKEKLDWKDPRIQKWIPEAQKQDSITLAAVRKILDRHGWLGTDLVGEEGNETIFLVIQHADSATMAHYFPMLAQSFILGKTPGQYYALMLDRLLTDRGQPQIYGTQIGMDRKPFPISDPEGLDERRKKMGLPTMAEYLKRMGG